MKKILPVIVSVIVLLYSCKDDDRQLSDSTENDLNTATTFLKAALRSDYNAAEKLILRDSLNLQDLEAWKRVQLSAEEKQQLGAASVIIHETRKVDSVTSIIQYSNSYRKQIDSIKVVKVDGEWLVDLKFVFKHKTDTLYQK
jgi:hypothetical protein